MLLTHIMTDIFVFIILKKSTGVDVYPFIRKSFFYRSFRAMSPKVRSMCNTQDLLDKKNYPDLNIQNVSQHKINNLDIKFSILQHSYNSALKHAETPSQLYALIQSIPQNLLLDDKLQWFSKQLLTYRAMPVITAHPTRVLSNAAIIELTHITDRLMQLKQRKIPFEHVTAFKANLAQSIQTWADGPVVPKTHLTPEDEAKFALFIYKRILATFPVFRQQVLQTFRKEHGGSEAYVASKLNKTIMESHQNILNWVWADCDGNHRITKNTMRSIIPLQQNAILELYTTRLETILRKLDATQHASEFETLQNMYDYFQRCARSIHVGIWFDVENSKKTQRRVLPILKDLQVTFESSPSTDEHILGQELSELHDLISLAGFFGGLKQYMRQTTQLNQRVINDLLTVLSNDYSNIQAFMNKRHYNTLSLDEKQTLLRWLRTEPRYFETLKQHQAQLHAETQQEIERLSFILEHADLFPNYITSDTENKTNFDEVVYCFVFLPFFQGHYV